LSLLVLPAPTTVTMTHAGMYANATNRRPTIEVELAALTSSGVLLGTTRTSVLIDSGADFTMLNSALAQRLGVDLAPIPFHQIGGIGGSVFGQQVVLKMHLCGQWVDVPVDFVIGQDAQLLGREGAFDALLVLFAHGISAVLAAQF
jgi:Aspartyl protease